MSDLSAPLSGRRARAAEQKQQRFTRRRMPVARLAFLGIAILVAAISARILFVETPDGGRPAVEVAINNTRNANSIAVSAGTPLPGSITAGPEIPIGEVDPALAAVPVEEIDAAAIEAQVAEFGLLPDLVEETEYGAIPRISNTGRRPFDAYARPAASTAATSGRPRIAIVVTGLGINLSGTIEAVDSLPETVTLAFAPYGKSLERTVGAARAEGHEIFLEVPLEPFDYPDNDPGPDTLLTGQPPRDNMDKLYRVMGKFGGYAGIINNMGARFTASGADFGPMIEELGARGLGYLDDGTSNRSLAPQLAGANGVPFGRANLQLDANPARAPILEQLEALETEARRNGEAIGLITALPVSIETIVEWMKGAEARGVVIVPASALME